jgi:citrate synthase
MTTPSEIYSPGLEGVIAGETAISTITGGLRYRGYPVVELAEKSTFDEVAFLLLHGELPTRSQLTDFNKRIAAAQKLPAVLSELLKKLPKDAVPMDVVRTGVSILANYDPEVNDNGRAANLNKAERLLAQIPLIIAEAYRATKGQPVVATKPELGFAANMLYMLKGTPPSAEDTKAFDVSLILYAEHEFNASTSRRESSALRSPTCTRASPPRSAL